MLPEAASQNHFKESLVTERLSPDTVLLCSQHLASAVGGLSSSVLLLARASCLAETFSVCHQSALVLFTDLFGHGHTAFFLLRIIPCMSDTMCTSPHFDDKTPE